MENHSVLNSQPIELNYFLKLRNSTVFFPNLQQNLFENACFSNVIIQALLALNEPFFNKVSNFFKSSSRSQKILIEIISFTKLSYILIFFIAFNYFILNFRIWLKLLKENQLIYIILWLCVILHLDEV
jgi:hypothetical protein